MASPPSTIPGGPQLVPRRDVSTNPMRGNNHEFIRRAELGRQPGPACQGSTRTPATTSSPAQSARRHSSTPNTTPSAREQGRLCHLSLSRRRAGTGLASSTMRALRRCTIGTCSSPSDSGLPADVLLGKFKKDVSFALRRGTIAQVTTHHHLALDGCAWRRLANARSSAEDEELLPALNGRATGRPVGFAKQSLLLC